MDILGKIKKIIPRKHNEEENINNMQNKNIFDNFPDEAKKDFNELRQKQYNHNNYNNEHQYSNQPSGFYHNFNNNMNNTMPPTHQRIKSRSLEDNNFSAQPMQRNYPNQSYTEPSVPFKEEAPPSLGLEGNTPEMEKLDSVMIELRNIKAQNVQILSEIRLLQDRLRRVY